MRIYTRTLVLALLLTTACTAFGAGSGDMATPSDQRPIPKSPETQAINAYNAGVRLVEKADELNADAARQTEAHKQKKTLDSARKNYSTALRKFAQAIEFQSGMYQAWNYLGYTQRKLGNYQDAVTAYDRALSIKPGYVEAIEYRGHAYLGLNRLSEAKESYLALYASNSRLAASLLKGMQEWVGAHRTDSAGVDGAMLESFASWVSERSKIAGQTVGLTREGATSAWK
jgi:tetratricopeptide (TPR) repeat protein